jgi:membrane fusion protein, multidrug efflux system
VSVRPVQLGVTDGDNVEVRSGLAPGDRIVIDGADKLRDGAKINIRTEAGAGTPLPPGGGKAGGKKQRSDNGQKQ